MNELLGRNTIFVADSIHVKTLGNCDLYGKASMLEFSIWMGDRL